MPNFKRQKAIMSAIDWDVEHMRDRITANTGNTTTPSNIFIDSPISSCGGMVVGADGHVYMIPYDDKYVAKIHSDNNEIVHNSTYTYSDGAVYDGTMQVGAYTSDTETKVDVNTDSSKYWGGVLAENGYIYCIPYCANYVLKIDTNYGSETYGKLSKIEFEITKEGVGGNYSYNYWKGGVLAPNGIIYCAPCNSSYILKIDTRTDTVSYMNDEFVSGLLGVSYNFCSGAVLTPHGEIAFVPYGSTRVPILKFADESMTWCVHDMGSTSNRWATGVYDPVRDRVTFIPNEKSLDVMELRYFTDGTSDITTNPYYTPVSVNFGNAVLAPNGHVYLLPKSTGEQCYELSSSSTGPNESFGNTDNTLQNWHAVLAPNGKIYSAGYGSKIMVVSPNSTGNLNFGLNTILSPYLNKF